MDPQDKLVAREFLTKLEKETPTWMPHNWAKVRRAGEEIKLYTPELRRTLISLWDKWSDEEKLKDEFAFLVCNGRWHIELSVEELHHLPLQPIVEGMEIWVKQRCSRK